MTGHPTISTYLNQLQTVSLPRWSDLPQFELYMDQVVNVINEYIRPLEVDELTPAMINNYVKQGVLTAPIKKKYARPQIANLLVISILKTVFKLDDIQQGITQKLTNAKPAEVYDMFILTFLETVHQTNSDFTTAFVVNKVNKSDTTNVREALVDLACNAVIQKMLVEHLVALNRPVTPVSSKKKKA